MKYIVLENEDEMEQQINKEEDGNFRVDFINPSFTPNANEQIMK